ncbi:hypothetical protein [Pyrobaculum sp.]|uniref:hypothetical protein n=1 Tax=Pyrobaculum sp. TaxID=2004705 RepID=UPI00316B7449
MLRVTIVLLATLAIVVLGQGPPRELFCASAGELGLAGEGPGLMFAVFERGAWRPAQAYIEPENVTFLLVPLLTKNGTDVSKAAAPGKLPPPVLRNETVVCFEAAPGRPAVSPPAPGLLIVAEKGGAKYHVFVARAEDVENPANFTLALPNKAEGRKPDKVELVDKRPPRGGKKGQPEADAQSVSSLSYWAAFKLYKTSTQLAAGQCASTAFDVPDGTSQVAVVLTGGTTPGAYQYTIYNTFNPSQRWSGTVYVLQGSPQTVAAWLSSGRAQYYVQICNVNSQTAAVYTSVLLKAQNQQYFRNDVIRTPRLYIYTYLPTYCNNYGLCPSNTHVIYQNSYFAIPGFYVDAASYIFLNIYVKVPKAAAPSGPVVVYWGGIPVATLYGYDSGNSKIYSGEVVVPESYLMHLLPTYGQGGVISIGPFTIYANAAYEVEVKAAVRRPQELAPAGDSRVYKTLVRRFRESFLFLDKRAFIADLDYAQSSSPGYFVISTKPFKDIGTSAYSYVRFYVKFYDKNMNPAYVSGGEASSVYTSSWWGDLLGKIPIISLILQIYDLIKSSIDALKKAVASFPIIGYVTLAMDAYVQAAQASVTVEKVDYNTLRITLYTGWYNDPLTARIYFAIVGDLYYVAVTGVEYFVPEPYFPWITVFSVDRPVLPYTSYGYAEYTTVTTYFPYRTLTCGVQEAGDFHPELCDPAYYR